MKPSRLIQACIIVALAATLAESGAAEAAYPGNNGKIAFVRGGDIWTVNPDGTGRVQITTNPANDSGPRWSPDGKEIAFTSTRDGHYEVYIMDANGSGQRRLVTSPPSDISIGPSWSPDGTRIAFERHDSHFWTIAVDGSDMQRITPGPTPDCSERWGTPHWSPDGTELFGNGVRDCYDHENPATCFVLITGIPNGCTLTTGAEYATDWSPDATRVVWGTIGADAGMGMFTIRRRGSAGPGFVELTDGSFNDGGAAWSPDGRRIVFGRSTPDGTGLGLYILDAADGSNLAPLPGSGANDCCTDWQPIPVNGYARPKSATPTQISLVPAYQACSSPNRTHGPPLEHPSCAPPVRSPTQLTVGTSDSNGKPTKGTSDVWISVKAGNPFTPQDEADLRLSGTINDVRASDLSDYTGSLSVRMTVRATDKDNTPHPGGPGAATTEDFTFSFPIDCTATADATIGGECTFDTTAETTMPGILKEGRRTLWQLGQLAVYDSAANLFMRQGIFVP